MAAKKSSENRRKSFAANQNKPPLVKAKRRPHSIVPGDRLSPLSKARRSLAPRKSILKGTLNIPTPEDTQLDSHTEPLPQSNLQPSIADETDPAPSDITRDFHTELHDNTSQKSFGRRVSFASHAQVRLFEVADGNTNSTASPQSSPVAPSAQDETPSPDRPQTMNDENAYPGAMAFKRRRSSLRSSVGGEESMDVDIDDTARGPFAFLRASHLSGSAIQDDDDDDEGQYEGEMEMTEAFQENMIRRRSLAMAPSRRPLSIIPPVEVSDPPQQDVSYDQDADESQQSYTDDNSTRSSTDADSSARQPVEYTIPLSKPLNPPAPPDELWYALRKMTHSGDTPHEPQLSSDDEGLGHGSGDGMDLDHAVERLMHARSSLPLIDGENGSNPDGNRSGDDSFSSLDNSIGENDIGDRTINVSKVFGKASLGGQSGLHSTMDSTSIFGGVLESPTANSIPSPVPARVESAQDPPKSSVFSPAVVEPAPSQSNGPSTSNAAPDQGPERASAPEPSFSFSPKSTSTAPPTPKTIPPSSSRTKPQSTRIQNPSGKQKPTPSAAFMPPVSRASPKKRPLSSTEAENDENSEGNRPGPAKRMTMANKWAATIGSGTTTESHATTTTPKPLTPSKKAIFQPPQAEVKPASSSLRRPSGYFARRKSMGVDSTVAGEVAEGSDKAAPQKKVALGMGRASVGSEVSGISVDLSRFVEKGKEKVVEESGVSVPEPDQQALPVPSPKRELRKSKSLKGTSPARTLTPQASPEVSRLLVSREDDDTQVKGGDVEMALKSTEKWRENVQQHDFANDDEGPPISIEQFFTMTGIRFMDEITAPRRSIHPSQLGPNSRARRVSSGEAPEIPLSEYATAIAVDVPQLKLYTRVSKDLQAWIAQSKVVYSQAEEEAAKLTPQLFTEYSQANEEGQEQLLHQLHLMKANSRGLAKSDWYDWKLGWVEGLYAAANKGFVELEADAKELEKINSLALEILPALEEEHEQVMRELEQEQADVAEIENGDKNYLNELKASITEQNLEVEALRAEVAERNSQLKWLQERLEEAESQKQEASTAISEANRLVHIHKNSTRSEVFRLKDRLETLENLHMFRVAVVNANMFEFVYASQFRVTLPCHKFRPRVEQVVIRREDPTRSKFKDAYPQLGDLFLRTARERTVRRGNLAAIQIVQYLADYWTSCSQLRCQLALLALKYPLSIEVMPPETPHFKANAVMVFPNTKAKAVVSFLFDDETYSRWPMNIQSIKCEVDVTYGPVDPKRIYNAVAARLAEASAAENHACLLDACMGAMDQYS